MATACLGSNVYQHH